MNRAIAREQRRRLDRWRGFPDVVTRPGAPWPAIAGGPPGGRGSANLRSNRGLESATLGPDTIRVAFLRVDFLTDRGGDRSTGSGRFDLGSADSLASPIDPPPHDRGFYESHVEALRRFYDAQSYGRFAIAGDVWPRARDGAYSLSDMEDFGPWEFSADLYSAAVRLFRAAMFAADSQSIAFGDRIPWDRYDRFVIIHAGSDLQSDVLDDSPDDIPSFTIGVSGDDAVIFPDSTTRAIDRASIVPETIDQDGASGALNGLLAHESGHNLFGFADVSDIMTGLPVVGYWSLMDSGHLVGAIVTLPDASQRFATGLLPPSVDPYQRQYITPDGAAREIALNDTVAMRAVERYEDLRRVTLTSDEYLLLENRYLAPADSLTLDRDDSTHVILGPLRPDRFEYDALLPGGGILVWHVDESVIQRDQAINADSTRRGLAIIEADGSNDLGEPASPFYLGAPTDPWFVGNRTLLNSQSTPPLRTNSGVDPQRTIEVLDTLQASMRVRVASDELTPTLLSRFEAQPAAGGIEVRWRFASPEQMATVALERSDAETGPWAPVTAPLAREGDESVALDRSVAAGETYFYRLNVHLTAGPDVMFGPVRGQASAGAPEFALGRIGPSPTQTRCVRIEYFVGRESAARVTIVDVQGRVRAVLVDDILKPGRHEASWTPGPGVPAGLYFVNYQAAGRSHTRRVVLTP